MMRGARRIRCLLLTVACSTAIAVSAPPATAAPYVSCPGGYIADNLKDCPELPKHPVGGPDARGGGGVTGGGGGVLGNLLDAVGLGGLGGLL